ncbi:TonB-dependent receptor [Ekhidna sp.]|uniref:TonB-dependent receptor n=1 Tax=Ekhidna sp. TaxID=2608089 RepID=UPI003CCBD028
MKRSLIIISLLAIAYSGFCQQKIPLVRLLQELESSTNNIFYYKNEWIDTIKVEQSFRSGWLTKLNKRLALSGFKVYVYQEENVFIYPNRLEFERYTLLNSQSVPHDTAKTQRIGDINVSGADRDGLYDLEGNVSNEYGTKLAGVNITIDGQLRAQTDTAGSYTIELSPGNYKIGFSYVGREPEDRFITFYSSGNLDISLFPESRLLDEVVIEGNQLNESSGLNAVGVQRISTAKLEKLPSFAGNVDVVKGAIVLPGVSTSGESSSYLNVRGGGNDQTLMLMNNATVYNPGHLLGFFSVYNGDFVSDVTLYKGNIPARYGVRASSVLDVKMNKWGDKKYSYYGGIGITDSNLGFKTKQLNDKLDIHIGGRLSYLDWVFDLIPDKDIIQSSAQFGDANFSSRYILNDKNSLFLSGYFGEDYFKYSDQIIYRWKTYTSNLKWSRLLKNDFVLETEFSTGNLNNSSESLQLNDEFEFSNGIKEMSLKSIISNEKIEGGIDITSYNISLGEIVPTNPNSLVRAESLKSEYALNLGLHGSYLFKINENLGISTGLRFNSYMNFGPTSVNVYGAGLPYSERNISGQEEIASGELESSQQVLEPRLGINYRIGNHGIRAGYSRINQFLHLISNTVLINPSTVWKASDRYIPRTTIDQYSLGFQKDFPEKGISVSVDGFYKKSANLIDYRDAAELVLNDDLEQEILRGEGDSYGAELLLSKDKGLLTGLISYTYSRSFIKVVDKTQGISINGGERYPFYSDRPHNVKASLDYKLSKKWTLSTNFTYVSGAPISAPLAVYEIEGVKVPYFSERNSERIPDYHRLDLVLTVKSRIRKTKKNNDRWVLTLYNLYGRDNVATIFFSSNNNRPAQPFKLINVGRMIPTITYKFEF